MRVLGQILAAVLLLLFTAPSAADIFSVKILSDDRHMVLYSNFEFSNTGYVSVAVSSVEISSNSSQPDPSRIGFFLLSDDLEFKRNPDLCPFDNKSISVLLTFSDLSPPPLSSVNKSHNVRYPGEYSLYFANCNDLSNVTMDVRAELYSIDDDGATKDYLSAGQPHPFFYFKFFLIYLCLQGIWISVSIKNQHCLQLIHIAMSMLIVTNLIYFLCAMANQHDLMVTGTHHGWRILFYLTRFMRESNFFVLIMLIGAGWCNWRRNLPDWALSSSLCVCFLQVAANVFFMLVAEFRPYTQNFAPAPRSEFMLIDLLCYLVVFFHVLCSALSFKEATDTSTYERSYSSLKEVTVRHEVFPFLVLAYIVFSRGLYDAQNTAFQETCTLVLSMAMLYMYRPFVLDDEDQKFAGFLFHSGV